MVPVVTIAASVLVLREPVTLVAVAGMALILLGMALSEREKRAAQVSPLKQS
jgi:drug/metabolite transporter (DMT)-like permease